MWSAELMGKSIANKTIDGTFKNWTAVDVIFLKKLKNFQLNE